MRAELAVTEEQLAFLEEEAEAARLDALVSETPLGEVAARETRRHADAQSKHRDVLLRSIADLVAEQDSLLDRLSAELTRP